MDASAEMCRTLGTAVFGMLAIPFFGIFLTPIFFYVIQRFADPRIKADVASMEE